MNCKKDELAYVRSTHPLEYLHGVTVTVREFFPTLDGWDEVWRFEFSGEPQRDDFGNLGSWGYMQDCHLVPISGVLLGDEETIETNVPEALQLALGIESRVCA